MLTSTRFQINYPNPTRTDTADVPRDIGSIVTQLEALGMQFGQGTHAARPAAGIQGRIYYETDTGLHYYDSGAAWIVVGGPPGPLSVTNAMLAANSVDSSKIADGSIVDADVSASAALSLAKLLGYPSDPTKVARGDNSWQQITNAMIAAAAGISPSKLAGYPANTTTFLRGDGTWTAAGSVWTIGSAPPGAPNNGDVWIFPADAAAYWMFVYDSAQATYKWRYAGGAPLSAVIDTEETSTSASYVDLATAGPTVTTPRAGDYRITFGARCWTSTGSPKYLASPSVGGGAAADADSGGVLVGATDATMAHRVNRVSLLKTGLAAATAIKLQYRADTTGSTQHWLNRQIDIIPVRVI